MNSGTLSVQLAETVSTLFSSNAVNCPITTFTLQTKDDQNVYSDYTGSDVTLVSGRVRTSTSTQHMRTYFIKASSAAGIFAYQEINIVVCNIAFAVVDAIPKFYINFQTNPGVRLNEVFDDYATYFT